MCLKLNMYLRALLNLARRHHDCVRHKVSETDCILDPLHIVYNSQSKTTKTRGAEPFWVSGPMAGGNYILSTFSTAGTSQFPVDSILVKAGARQEMDSNRHSKKGSCVQVLPGLTLRCKQATYQLMLSSSSELPGAAPPAHRDKARNCLLLDMAGSSSVQREVFVSHCQTLYSTLF